MDIIIHLGQQPLFLLISAIIVLLITDWKPTFGFIAFGVWSLWMYAAYAAHKNTSNQ